MPTLRIIRPSSREATDLLPARIAELRAEGFEVLYDDLPGDPEWTYVAAPAAARAQALMGALTETASAVVMCARGGYGASDLLPLLDWGVLKRVPPKVVVGFSDVSALHCGLYGKLGWAGLHGPMPGTVLWGKEGRGDIVRLLGCLKGLIAGRGVEGGVDVEEIGRGQNIEGPLFGGCFTVLSALIGTPYFPKTLAGHLVFVEDTDESPARLMRALNQWLQAGALAGVKALVVGHLRGLGDKVPDSAPFVLREFARRTGLPVFHAPACGHTSPNEALMIGAQGVVAGGRLSWRLAPPASGRTLA